MILPKPLQRIYDVWMAFSKLIGKVMSPIILTILWIVGFGLYAVILKIVAVLRKPTPAPVTYWIDAEVPTDMQRQF
jgi:hypothetical protein